MSISCARAWALGLNTDWICLPVSSPQCSFAILAVLTLRLAWSQFAADEIISSYMDWPTWLSTVFVPIGTILTILRLAISSATHVNVLVSGREDDSVKTSQLVDHSISTGE